MSRSALRVLALGALLLGTAAAIRKPSAHSPKASAVELRPTPEPTIDAAVDPARTADAPVAYPPAPSPARSLLKDHLKRLGARASVDELRASEAETREGLSTLTPDEGVELLLERPAPAALRLILEAVDRGLRNDREAWERALVLGLEKAAGDAIVLEEVATAALGRVTDEDARGQAARLLMKRATNDPLTVLAARLASGEAAADVRDWLWSKVPAHGAVEGLGSLIEPAEAARLEALGPKPDVVRALEHAYERTRDPAFRAAIVRMGFAAYSFK